MLDRSELKQKQPEIAENPNLTEVIYSCFIRAKYGIEYELLLNLKRIKESKEPRMTLYVPEELVGRVIGKGGSNIKKIEEATGKKFRIMVGDFRADPQNKVSQNGQQQESGSTKQTKLDPRIVAGVTR